MCTSVPLKYRLGAFLKRLELTRTKGFFGKSLKSSIRKSLSHIFTLFPFSLFSCTVTVKKMNLRPSSKSGAEISEACP
ncbi:hypothetical protein TcasGA2_TC033523 [Tribolium castaneum]|uniref:Uncharacterized protein n=1 Tax=Tribolium castaneum TaxID=7070 RepID=A0A139WG41_TRICA|nr:hypothetical protein TcasGA2_TC033523 [Tribolium castaneum]